MESKETPIVAHKESTPVLQVGDRVIVTRKSKPGEDPNIIIWTPTKERCIGNIGTIINTNVLEGKTCYTVNMDDKEDLTGPSGTSCWRFPAAILKKATKWKTKTLQKKKDKR